MNNDSFTAQTLLKSTGISIVDAAILIRRIVDYKSSSLKLQSNLVYCDLIIQTGLSQHQSVQQNMQTGFTIYLNTKEHLRETSLRDIRYLGKRLLTSRPDFAQAYFSQLGQHECEQWLQETFSAPSQYNKGRAMLHALFQFACAREWCDKNPVRYIPKKRIKEQTIQPLNLNESLKLLETSRTVENGECAPATALLIWAGLRPNELMRLKWGDIDLPEQSITIRADCSKTGGVRQIDICAPLLACLRQYKSAAVDSICPPNWILKWKRVRDAAGFKGIWVQDVLRHTYASFHAKHYKNLPLLQLNMGHRDQSLLRARYVNMHGLTKDDAKQFFSNHPNLVNTKNKDSSQ